jgi:hypothetical protein
MKKTELMQLITEILEEENSTDRSLRNFVNNEISANLKNNTPLRKLLTDIIFGEEAGKINWYRMRKIITKNYPELTMSI